MLSLSGSKIIPVSVFTVSLFLEQKKMLVIKQNIIGKGVPGLRAMV